MEGRRRDRWSNSGAAGGKDRGIKEEWKDRGIKTRVEQWKDAVTKE